ncbi:MAG: hypothetical protein ACOX6P_08010 [Candidatus Merdivicinus sp.]|jgi:hypothetical protein
MDWTPAEQQLSALKTALETGDPAAAYLGCAAVLQALLEACYLDAGMVPPSPDGLFSGLLNTRLGREYIANLEAYIRICYRLDGVRPGRSAEDFPQYTDAERLLCRMRGF